MNGPTVTNFSRAAEQAQAHPDCGRASNLYRDFDFTGVTAFAMQGAEKVLVCEIFNNRRGRNWDALAAMPWIVIGKPELSCDGSLHMHGAVTLSPAQLSNIYRVTNYSPIDCLRGMYYDVTRLAPQLKRDIKLEQAHICEEFSLGPTVWSHVYRELHSSNRLSMVLRSTETRRRFECVARETAKHLHECLFTTYRVPEEYDTDREFLHTMVLRGDVGSPDAGPRWRKLLRDSNLIHSLTVAEKYGVRDRTELEALAKDNEQIRRELEAANANEWEVLRKNVAEVFPGAFKGSVIEDEKGAGPGAYRFMVTHSHPIVDEQGHIEPSVQDLESLLNLRLQHAVLGGEGFSRHERLVHHPIFTIIQPADWDGDAYFGLVLQERAEMPVGRELPISNDADLLDLIQSKGVRVALADLGIESFRLKGRVGRDCRVLKGKMS